MAETPTPMSQVQTLLDQMITEGTFTAAALEGVKALKTQATVLAQDVERKDARIKELSKAGDDLLFSLTASQNQVRDLTAQVATLTARMDTIDGRERAQDVKDALLACEKEKVVLVKEMFSTVFRPNSVREHVFGRIPVPIAGHPGNPQYGQPPMGGTVIHSELDTTRTTEEA